MAREERAAQLRGRGNEPSTNKKHEYTNKNPLPPSPFRHQKWGRGKEPSTNKKHEYTNFVTRVMFGLVSIQKKKNRNKDFSWEGSKDFVREDGSDVSIIAQMF
ncbi:MAG: hypothetical protein A2032_02125 [Chloroflexi bacterium RBG_19FT_COMBO_49_13]|nr:MAG: hypothetical protein A2032_02125 [Chloroflexi bacterium RBG_19FT_COMBO_49_13]